MKGSLTLNLLVPIFAIFFCFAVVAFVVIAIIVYNALVALKHNITKAWANIDVILKQRYDEIPNLVQVCEQYANYETATIQKIMETRQRMVSGKSQQEKMDASNELSAALGSLLAIGEAYPELKANENFLQLQYRLSDLENTLADRREFYNDSVTLYNIRIKQFPDVFLAKHLGYTEEVLFKVSKHELTPPSLKMKLDIHKK
ncbi:MAG: LemA family protein [Candidatus Brocadiales bacterium]|nr:LemA family protein [Candidatus Brocadiales bacterium]MBL7058805.1 LemA family protein [Patescibacteria group bacterium]